MSSEEEKSETALRHSIFRDLPHEKLTEIAEGVEERIWPAHTMIFEQGDPGDSYWVIRSGRVRVFRRGEGGLETALSILGPGEGFGELALLTGNTRSANVETLEETHLSVLHKEEFHRVVRDFPDVSLAFIKQMSAWLLRDDRRLEIEAQKQYEPPALSGFDFALVLGLSVVFALVFNQANPHGIPLLPRTFDDLPVTRVLPSEVIEEYRTGDILFIDAMPSSFFDQQHVAKAINVPLALFDIIYMMALQEINKNKRLIVYGATISRHYDKEVANKLVLRGHKNVGIMEGGLSAWKERGYPVEP